MQLLKKAGGAWYSVGGFSSLWRGLGIVLATTGSPVALEGIAPETLRVEVIGQALSVEVGDTALRDALYEVARQAGLEVETWGDLGQVRSQAFEGVPIEEASGGWSAIIGST